MSWFRTGTLSVTNGSTAVTGSGTTWIANAAVGEALLAPDGKLYEIASISSDTSLTLGSVYLGTTQSAQSYVIVPSQSYIRDLASQAATLVNTYSSFYNTIGQGKFAEGTVASPAVSFSADTNTGFYHSASDEVTLVANGVAIAKWGTTGFTILSGTSPLVVSKIGPIAGQQHTVPAVASDTLTLNAATQTLTNKTLVAAAVSGAFNGTVGATTPSTGAFTTLSSTGNTTLGDASTDTVQVNGYMGVGGAPNAAYGIYVVPTALTGTIQRGITSDVTATSTATNTVDSISGRSRTAAAVFTVTYANALHAIDAIKGAGSTITYQNGLYVDDQTQGTNNYGITSLVSSGTNKWNIYASGTAANYFAGKVLVGGSTPSNAYAAAAITVGPDVNANWRGLSLETTDLGASTGNVGVYLSAPYDSGTVNQAFFRVKRGAGSIYNGAEIAFNGSFRFLGSMTEDTSERMRIDSSGNVGIGVTPSARNNTRLQIVDGIGFPATQVASSDANTLDDYEEGTWTGAFTFATPGNLVATVTCPGRYTKIGRLVTLDFVLDSTVFTHTTAASFARITGLPFAVAAGYANYTGLGVCGGVTKAGYTDFGVRAVAGQSYLQLMGSGSGQVAASLTAADFPTGGTLAIYGQIKYEV